MRNRLWFLLALFAVMGESGVGQDAQTVLRDAAAAMGVGNLKSIRYVATGYAGVVGQSYSPEEDWPLVELSSYSRTIDFAEKSSKEEMVRRQGKYPSRGGGVPIVGEQRQTLLVSGNYAWNLQGNNVVPAPAAAEMRQLDIWLTPPGFIKAAMAGSPVAISRFEAGEKLTVVSFTALGKYRVNGTINHQNQVTRVQTWFPDPVRGDMYYETMYSNYRDFGGVKFPTRFHQHVDHDDNDLRPNISGGHSSFEISVTDARPNVSETLTVPDAVRQATIPPVRVESQKLADGVWLLAGGSHNSVAVEFRDFIAVVEAPLNEERSLAVIAEVYRLIPNKQIRYVVNTHHHFDHLGGIRTYVHEGATIITHQGNRAFYEEVLADRPWTLKPDRLSLYPPEEVAEGYTFELVERSHVLSDRTRTMEIHLVQGLRHSAGMLIAYLPKEKIVIEGDLYNPPASNVPVPIPPNASNMTFYNNVQRLHLDISQIAPIHGRVVPMEDFLKFVGKAQ